MVVHRRGEGRAVLRVFVIAGGWFTGHLLQASVDCEVMEVTVSLYFL